MCSAGRTASAGFGSSVADLRHVVDAGVLIAFLNREEGRYERSRELLKRAQDGDIQLWAPAVILVEVARWTSDADPQDLVSADKLDAFLDSDWLRIVEVDRRLATIARRVLAATRIRKGVDALYIAAAVAAQATQVLSWDDGVIGEQFQGVTAIEPPELQGRQLDLLDTDQD